QLPATPLNLGLAQVNLPTDAHGVPVSFADPAVDDCSHCTLSCFRPGSLQSSTAYPTRWCEAKTGVIAFLDHLLEWSGDHAILLLVLSRPEGIERRGLVLSRRSVTNLPIDPLSD